MGFGISKTVDLRLKFFALLLSTSVLLDLLREFGLGQLVVIAQSLVLFEKRGLLTIQSLLGGTEYLVLLSKLAVLLGLLGVLFVKLLVLLLEAVFVLCKLGVLLLGLLNESVFLAQKLLLLLNRSFSFSDLRLFPLVLVLLRFERALESRVVLPNLGQVRLKSGSQVVRSEFLLSERLDLLGLLRKLGLHLVLGLHQ